jgi:hypothetical protein
VAAGVLGALSPAVEDALVSAGAAAFPDSDEEDSEAGEELFEA